ncbi:MAG: cytochrome c biogenesis protein CcsA, partial [Candidatus Omnitrophica bacterium]|nr:cytochrome c biogenesis protein CcsA [Candidatus Omnitrophota bacterium]
MICSTAKSASRFPLIFALIVASSLSLSACSKKDQNPGESLIHTLPVQHDGRVKPFSAYAGKTVRLVTSKSRFEKQSPTDLMLTLLSDPALLRSKKWIRVDYHPLKSSLSLPVEDKYFSFDQIQPKIQSLTALASSAKQKRDADERPDKIEQKAELVLSRTAAVYSLLNQTSMATVPQNNQTWRPVTADHPINAAYRKLLTAWKSGNRQDVMAAAKQWHQLSNSSVDSAQIKKNKMEDMYLRYHPFQKAWILYLFSALLFLGSSKKIKFKLACLFLAGAFFFHLAGLGLRVYILGRPPVSNMYESMIFMGFILMFAGTIFSIIHRSRFLVQAGAIGAAAILIYADLLPIDGSLGTLVPVLRSNYWLTIHVLTIVASYGAYGLALVASHRHLWLDLKNTWSEAEKKKSGHLILRIIEVGTLLIAVG